MRIFTKVARKLVTATLLVVLAVVIVDARPPGELTNAAQAGEPKQIAVAEGETITLVMHSARDCKYCVRWKGHFAGQGNFEAWARRHPGTRLFIVERASIASNETPADYPPELAWLSERYRRDGRVRPGTPAFEVFVARNLVLRSYGLAAWDDEVFPAIKNLDARRSHSDAAAATAATSVASNEADPSMLRHP
ncbi:hypothetical protein AWB79_06708 [Caballeronia hypogeia]|uniref:Thioredoxin-like fold domain-containing protein n=1 Tax=Caballeronia hypogeia TaxID=1777140 RepID=A0A158DCJ7_9BURK|nr:hypothetical protein [Caballeronia hypogeia]SAK91527.1 hypothetical protein AWB79_06708 [Caballeronia hypogeia]